MWKIVLGLLAVMLANILLGAKLADLKNQFEWKKVWEGLFKSLCIVAGCFLMYLCSYWNPDIMIVSINEVNVNLMDAMRLIFIAGIVLYGAQDINKLQKILGTSVNIDEVTEDEIINLDTPEV